MQSRLIRVRGASSARTHISAPASSSAVPLANARAGLEVHDAQGAAVVALQSVHPALQPGPPQLHLDVELDADPFPPSGRALLEVAGKAGDHRHGLGLLTSRQQAGG